MPPLPKHNTTNTNPNFLWGFGSKERVGGAYEYSFQAQEHDDEIKGPGNSINYKYRMHDTRLGRFFAIDPLSSKYPWNSPYAFAENEIIRFIELEGLEKGGNYYDYSNAGGLSTENAYYKSIETKFKANIDKSTDDAIMKSGSILSASMGLFSEFLLGNGPTERNFEPDHVMTNSLKYSKLTNSALDAYVKGFSDYQNNLRNEPPNQYGAEFLMPILDDSDPVTENSSAVQYIGSATFYFSLDKENKILNIQVIDYKTPESLFYHIPGTEYFEHERDGGWSPMGTTIQIYNFSFTYEEIKDMFGVDLNIEDMSHVNRMQSKME